MQKTRVKFKFPRWKLCWNHFNEHYFGWLERFVDGLIPWLVLLLLFIILGEFSHSLNVFHWWWLDAVAEFFERYELFIRMIDGIIISFFILELYFHYFRSRTFLGFLKSSFLDILAVLPLGFVFRVARLLRIRRISESQSLLHVATKLEKTAARLVHEGEIASKAAKLEKTAKLSRLISRIPRFFRLARLRGFFKRKKTG